MEEYPNGFIYTRNKSCIPTPFVPGPIENLWVSSQVKINTASSSNASITILGICVNPLSDVDPASFAMKSYEAGYNTFLDSLDYLCGRFVIFLKTINNIQIFSDATGMRSVFYNKDMDLISSHASMIALEGKGDVPFRYGYPGNNTPFKNISLLVPNTFLDLSESKTKRFWPRENIEIISADIVCDDIVNYVVNVLKKVAQDNKIKLALTAGLDSRVMLSLLLKSGVSFETYTYGGGKDTKLDIAVAKDLAAKCGIKHTVVRTHDLSDKLSKTISNAVYTSHHHSAIEPLKNWFNDNNTLCVTANLLEIGRDFYAKYRCLAEPITPHSMAELHINTMPRTSRLQVGSDKRNFVHYSSCFSSFIEDTAFNESRPLNFDPYDQFYWEHRMSSWHGVNMNERDFYAQAFIPFNARVIFKNLLSVTLDQRRSAKVFYDIIDLQSIGDEFVPINPSSYR